MNDFVRKYLVEINDGDSIFTTRLTIGWSYRIESRGKVVQSGVLSFEQYNNILKLEEDEEDVEELKEELEVAYSEKEPKIEDLLTDDNEIADER